MIGGFQVGPFQLAYQQISGVTPSPTRAPDSPLGGSKKRRGPYSDPRIYEAYIARCIAERAAPRQNVEVALLKESLVAEVEQRRAGDLAERDALLRENQILERLIAIESSRRSIAAIAARQRQIARQIQQLEDEEEAGAVLAFFDAL